MQPSLAELNALEQAHLAGVRWLHGGRDLELSIEVADGRQWRVRCLGVTGLQLDLAYRPNRGGAPLAYRCEHEPTATGRRSFHWTFPPAGFVALECDELVVQELDGERPAAARGAR